MTNLPELRIASYTKSLWHSAFSFVATLAADLPHGHPTFDGMLKRTDGGWRAATWVGPGIWGPVGKTRADAVRNIIPATVKLIEAYMVEEAKKREELQRVDKAGTELLAALEASLPWLQDSPPPILSQCHAAIAKAQGEQSLLQTRRRPSEGACVHQQKERLG